MVRCYECGKQYDYDDDGFCPKCGAFNQPARGQEDGRRAAAVSDGTAAGSRGRKAIQRDMEDNLREMEQAMKKLLGGGKSQGRRLPGGRL